MRRFTFLKHIDKKIKINKKISNRDYNIKKTELNYTFVQNIKN